MSARMQRAQPWLGTLVEVAAAGADAASLNAAIGRAFARIAAIHGAMSFHDIDSELSHINRHAARDWVTLSDDQQRVAELQQELTRIRQQWAQAGRAASLGWTWWAWTIGPSKARTAWTAPTPNCCPG